MLKDEFLHPRKQSQKAIRCTPSSSHSMTCTMSCDQRYPFPQVFLVDEGGGPHNSKQPPNLIPCWSFPPAAERTRSREKSRGCMGISFSLAAVVLMLFLVVFAALGFEAWQILQMQKKIKDWPVEKVEPGPATELRAPLKQIGLYKPESSGEDEKDRPAAHVIGRIGTITGRTLRWEPKTGQAFTSGGVTYRVEDGALQVSEAGLYHIHSRVELIFKGCFSTSSFEHSIFVRREGRSSTLMEAHRTGFCPRSTGQSWTTESFLGSALPLKIHDKVYVNVSHPDYLSHSHYANFFGLYKI